MSTEVSPLTPHWDAILPPSWPESFESWIQRTATGPDSLFTVINSLTAWSLPPEPWRHGAAVNPFRGDLDSQLWFWNRAANHYLDRGNPLAAAEVWSAHYLVYLSLQLRFHQRYHKGLPLCNIGFAFDRAGRKKLAVKCWLLGVIEDAITNTHSAADEVNSRNLRKHGIAPAVLDQLIATIESRFSSQAIVPIFPEAAIEVWLHPAMIGASEPCFASVDELARRLARSYPALPDPSRPWENTLAPSWGFADWAAGVLDGE